MRYKKNKGKSIFRKVTCIMYMHGAFNKFPDFFEQAFKIVVDSGKFAMLLLYIL